MKTDRELYRDVIDELGCDGRVGGLDIDVAVEGGVVTLSGTVASIRQRDAAERAVAGIEGVKRVVVSLDVAGQARPDASSRA